MNIGDFPGLPVLKQYVAWFNMYNYTLGMDLGLKYSHNPAIDNWFDYVKPELCEIGEADKAELIENTLYFCHPALLVYEVFKDELKLSDDFKKAVKAVHGQDGIVAEVIAAMPLSYFNSPFNRAPSFEQLISSVVNSANFKPPLLDLGSTKEDFNNAKNLGGLLKGEILGFKPGLNEIPREAISA